MARLITCNRCQAQVDVAIAKGGDSLTCSDCGASLRVPTGETGKHQKVGAPAGAAAGKAEASKPLIKNVTPIMRKMANMKGYGAPGTRMPTPGSGGYDRGSNASAQTKLPLIIGGVVLGIAVIAGAIIVMSNKKEIPPTIRSQEKLTPGSGSAGAMSPTTNPTPPPKDLPKDPPKQPDGTTKPPDNPTPLQPSNAKKDDWDHWATTLKGGGSRFDDPSRPETAVIMTLKRYPAKTVVESMLKYFDDEDPAYARMLNVAFNEITGEKMPDVRPAGKAEGKKRWEDWLAKQPK